MSLSGHHNQKNLIKCKFRRGYGAKSSFPFDCGLFGDKSEFAFLCVGFGWRTFYFWEEEQMQLYEIHKSCITEEVLWAYDEKKATPHWFVFHLFLFLRAHVELLEDADYRRLYDECVDYLNKYMNQNKSSLGLEYTDYCNDLGQWGDAINDSGDASQMCPDEVEHFLAFRRRAWNS